MFQISRKAIRQCSSALAVVLLLSGTAMAAERTFTFQIPRENAARALNDFAKQAGVRILFPYDLAAAHTAPAISGKYTRDECLAFLLKDTGLEVAEQTETAITLRAVRTAAPVSGNSAETPTEVIVTGTHIRGANPSSPVHTLTRKDIEQSGYSQMGDLVRSLPENFNGGQNPGVAYAGGDLTNQNISNASTVNLRGLGSDATLVLLNGHRLGADAFFQGADISAIPLSAIQRIDVVPDGASALYGADAVAGVMNVVLRRNFKGGEISARAGTSAEGGGDERGFSALTGMSGYNSYLVMDYDYSKQDPVRTGERRALSNMYPITTLLRAQERQSLFLSAGHDFGEVAKLSFDALYSERKSHSTSRLSPTSLLSNGAQFTPSLNAALTLDVSLPRDWHLRASAVGSGSRNSYFIRYPAYNLTAHTIYKNELQSFEVTADGRLLTLPSGDVKTAFGAGYRDETFQQGFSGSSYVRAHRRISYIYGETSIPLVAPSTTRVGLHEFSVDASFRTEQYDDLGTSTNPKIGFRYMPTSDLTLRGTWGRSFKAPSLLQMYSAHYVTLDSAANLGGASNDTVLLSTGGNPSLKPERSRSWTAGFDYAPTTMKNLRISASYFDIDYTDRVVTPVPDWTTSLPDPQYAPFFDMAPSAAAQSAMIASADVFYNDVGSYDPTTVVAILHDQYTNAAAQTAKGIDLSVRDNFAVGQGDLSVFANATWLTLRQQTLITQPVRTLSGNLYYAPKFRARGGLSWQSGGFSATGIVNFLSSETDTGVTPAAEIASWTTVDATVNYALRTSHGALSGVKFALAASNLFDKIPPRTYSPAATLPHFDQTNASILGRYVSFTVTKAW
ncbi:TonB-dependent receptor [Asticcacaulis sp.]|uniref:TonB-dependent receptor n=1 Tax=Asticcacaulis sp. TaxID=1872648 RepID=UPI002C239534|nr:TonB-dependent receptor [Asticcacaulis sp.]HTM82197.1 TonB-dependent receptor [Asticcacaulis sp.]